VAGDALDGGMGVREQEADVALPRGAQERVDHRVQEDVAVGMAQGPAGMGDLDAAQEELPSGDQFVNVPTVPDGHEKANITWPMGPRHRPEWLMAGGDYDTARA